jgi:hypothetical protein
MDRAQNRVLFADAGSDFVDVLFADAGSDFVDVLFADAGSDFVDVLLTFLMFPLSAVQFCTADAPSPGCLSNLRDKVGRLTGSKLLKVDACHGMLLTHP